VASKKQDYVLPGHELGTDPGFEPVRSMIVENLLNQYKIPFHVDSALDVERTRPRQDQDQGASTAQIRVINKLDQPTVDRYTDARLRGEPLPAVLTNHQNTDAFFTNITGNHRRESVIAAGLPTIAAYIINVGQDMAQLLAEEEQQASQPLPLSRDDIERIVIARLSEKMSYGEIARRLKLKESEVSSIAAMNRATVRLVRVGHDVTQPPLKKIVRSKGLASALDTIHDDDVFAEAAGAVAETNAPVKAARDLTNDVNSLRDKSKELDRIRKFRKDRAADMQRAAANVQPPPARQIRGPVSVIMKYTAEQLVTGLTTLERADLIEDMRNLYDLSSDVLQRLGTLNGNGAKKAPAKAAAPTRKRATTKAP
jgi:hypothetical protein